MPVLDATTLKLAMGAAALKGIVMAVMLRLLEIDFWDQLVIATVSAILTGTAVIVSAIITVRATRTNYRAIEHVKRGLGLDRRSEDPSPKAPGRQPPPER